MQNSNVANGQSYCGGTDLYGSRVSRPEYLFIKELLLGAGGDSPTEIREWCKSELCRYCCDWMGVDINDYRRGMLRIVLNKKEEDHPRVKTHADDYMGPEEEDQKAPVAAEAEVTAEPTESEADIAIKAADKNTLTLKNANTFEKALNAYSSNHPEETDEEIIEQRKLGPLFENACSARMAAR